MLCLLSAHALQHTPLCMRCWQLCPTLRVHYNVILWYSLKHKTCWQKKVQSIHWDKNTSRQNHILTIVADGIRFLSLSSQTLPSAICWKRKWRAGRFGDAAIEREKQSTSRDVSFALIKFRSLCFFNFNVGFLWLQSYLSSHGDFISWIGLHCFAL